MENKVSKIKWYFLIGLLIIAVVIYAAILRQTGGKLTVTFLDVGQGDAIFIEAPDGRQMLIDGGPDRKILQELNKVMPFYDKTIDVVLATHPDQDHIGGLPEVLNRYSVGLFVRTTATSSSEVFKSLLEIIKSKNIKEDIINQVQDISLGGGVDFDVLFPDKDASGWESNTSSIVGKLIYGGNSFLFTGDSPATVEKYLVGKYGSLLKSDVFKAGHHGSKTSNSELFVGFVNPLYTVISVGLNNRYGHPNKEALDIFAKFKEKVLETLNGGLIKFESDGENILNFSK